MLPLSCTVKYINFELSNSVFIVILFPAPLHRKEKKRKEEVYVNLLDPDALVSTHS